MEAIGSVVGGLIGDRSAKRAADAQSQAAAAALEEQRRQFDLAREDQAPYREAGVEALTSLRGFQEPALRDIDVMGEPGYMFGLKSGRDALEGSAAAGGGLYSGNTLKALTRYGNDYATTKYGDAWNRMQASSGNRWNRLAALAGVGQTANQQTAQAGRHYADAAGGIGMSNANAQGAAGMARGQIWGNALNGVVSAGQRNNWWAPSPTGGSFGAQLDPFFGGTGGSGD
jgi:hypothetical protein